MDDAITQAQSMERGTLMMKIDIKSTFRLLSVDPADCHLFMMPPKLFNISTDLLAWNLERQGVHVSPIIDDYLT